MVTTYSPSCELSDRLLSLLEQVDRIILVDDSGNNSIKLQYNSDSIIVIKNLINVGIAESLNKGVSLAGELEYKYVLTLDDDTDLSFDYVSLLYKHLEVNGNTVGLVNGCFNSFEYASDVIKKHAVITSGSLFKYQTFVKVGGFSNEMFIDLVDFDFCLKIKKVNESVNVLTKANFKHQIGESLTGSKKILGLEFETYNHAPFRIYYQTRNVFYILRQHFITNPIYCLYLSRTLLFLPFNIFLFQTEKLIKLKNYVYGVSHGFCGKWGRL